jgi:UDPglucose 6-dehydrogenase
MVKEKLGIIGHGIVGQALSNGFKSEEVHIYDKYKDSETLEDVVKKSDFIFVCLPTPVHEGGGMDLSIIEDAIAELNKLVDGRNKIVTIKSSVIPGTTRRLSKSYPRMKLAFNPEFLTESNYLDDFLHADRTIIGADKDTTSLALVALYRKQFPNIPIFQTDLTTAEMVKFTGNTFLSTVVMFANEMYDLCEKLGVKYEEVKKMLVADHRIHDSHLDVTSLRGFGGKCFPKDIQSLIALGQEMKSDMALLDAVWKKNLRIRKVRDWEEIPFAVTMKSDKKSVKYSAAKGKFR